MLLLITNRKRPRGFSESFSKPLLGGLDFDQQGSRDSNIIVNNSSINNGKREFTDSIVIDSSDSENGRFRDDDFDQFDQDFEQLEGTIVKRHDNASELVDEVNSDGYEEDDDGGDNDDIIILEERIVGADSRGRNNLDLALLFLDNDEETAYNMFNVNNSNYNYDTGPIKKQRTSSLPQLPQVRCFYNRILPEIIMKAPKMGNIKPAIVPFLGSSYSASSSSSHSQNNSNFSSSSSGSGPNSNTSNSFNSDSCDDKDGHYIIKLGEIFADRFTILRLLGQGTFGKVIEGVDKYTNERVAIKIIRNIPKYRDAAKIELRILLTLKKFDQKNLNHCIHLRECFDYRGHICIVTDLLKISLYDFLERNKFISFPGLHIQAIMKQLIRLITFLHDLLLIHTDLKPENILLHDDLNIKRPLLLHTIRLSYASLKKKLKKFPKYLKVLNDPSIEIIDFGSAIFNDEYHLLIVSTRHYRAPEIILGTGWSFPCDMWLAGCILVELILGEPLFKTHDNLEHLAMIQTICGCSIDKLMVKSLKSLRNDCGLNYFDLNYELIFSDGMETPIKFIELVEKLSRIDIFLSQRLGLNINCDYSLKENYEKNSHLMNFGNFTFWWFLIDLIRKLFVVNPNKRLTASEAMEHPWFNLGIEDEGTIN